MTKFISLLICLFLCATQLYQTQEKVDYLTLSKEVTLDQASTLSSKIQEDINRCLKIEELEKQIEGMCLEEKNTLEKTIQRLKKKNEKLNKEKETIFLQNELDERELKIIADADKIQKKLARMNKQLKRVNETLDRISNEIEPITKRRMQDQEAQATLEKRFMEIIPEFSDEGEYDIHKVIGGSEKLPAYGAPKAYKNSSNTSCLVAGEYAIDTFSGNWIYPINGGNISAGTWYYPGGGMHLGMDYAVSLFTSVMAPANGLILYADNPVDSNNGYLGNMCGWPYGGGNTIAMICAMEGAIYGVTFAHLSNNIYVYAGQQVAQGQVIALSGNSGNSTGPHCHIEMFTISTSLEEVVDYFASTADFSFGCGWSAPATCSGFACRVRPETIL